MADYLPRNHPIRHLLEQAATGTEPTRGQLDQLGHYGDELPEGQSLSRYRAELTRNAREVAATAQTGSFGEARRQAETGWRAIAARMAREEAALDGEPEAERESTDDIARRMFG